MDQPGNTTPTRLARSAGDFLQRACGARTDEAMHHLVPLFVATGIEHLAKAVLAQIHPTLIAGPKFDDLLHALGLHNVAKGPPSGQRTIAAIEALERCVQLTPPLHPLLDDVRPLLASRNGMVHLALPPVVEVERAITTALRIVDVLTPVVGMDFEDILGPHAAWARTVLSERATAIEREVAEVLAVAAETFRRRSAALTEEEFAALSASVGNKIPRSGTEQYQYLLSDCPGCSNEVVIEGDYDVDWEVEYDVADGEPYPAGVYPRVYFDPAYLYCPFCHLELDGAERLAVAGITREEREDVDPEPFYRDYYEEEFADRY